MQIRRVGSLRITPQQNGLPVSDLPIELASVEFGESVGEWLRRGLIHANQASLVTDSTGLNFKFAVRDFCFC